MIHVHVTRELLSVVSYQTNTRVLRSQKGLKDWGSNFIWKIIKTHCAEQKCFATKKKPWCPSDILYIKLISTIEYAFVKQISVLTYQSFCKSKDYDTCKCISRFWVTGTWLGYISVHNEFTPLKSAWGTHGRILDLFKIVTSAWNFFLKLNKIIFFAIVFVFR